MTAPLRHILSRLLCLTAAALTLSACGADSMDDEPMAPASDTMLDISVAIATPQALAHNAGTPLTRVDYSAPTGPNEMMHQLRIIIVRPNGIIEHNDYITEPFLNNPAISAGSFRYKVASGEKKHIYLVVNETATRTDRSGKKVPVVNFDFSTLQPGTTFPNAAMADLRVSLNDATETLDGILPMSEYHTVDIPLINATQGTPTIAKRLFITRAAVKFSICFTNSSEINDFTIDRLSIDRLSRHEYFFPRNATYNSAGEITAYDVPNIANNEYYTYSPAFSEITLPRGGSSHTLPSFYLLEGKYTDTASADPKLNYKLTLRISGNTYSRYLPNLDQLPRNTHVVVFVNIKSLDNLQWQIDLRPYSSVELKPDFGMPYPGQD